MYILSSSLTTAYTVRIGSVIGISRSRWHKEVKDITYVSHLNDPDVRAIRDTRIIQPSPPPPTPLRATSIKSLLLALLPFARSFYFSTFLLYLALRFTVPLALQSGSAVVMLSDRRCIRRIYINGNSGRSNGNLLLL